MTPPPVRLVTFAVRPEKVLLLAASSLAHVAEDNPITPPPLRLVTGVYPPRARYWMVLCEITAGFPI
jgi:hypothetical protein